MSTSDEILQTLQQAGAAASQSISAGSAAIGKTDQALQQSAQLGAPDKIAKYREVKAAIEEALASLNGSREKIVQALNKARAAAG